MCRICMLCIQYYNIYTQISEGSLIPLILLIPLIPLSGCDGDDDDDDDDDGGDDDDDVDDDDDDHDDDDDDDDKNDNVRHRKCCSFVLLTYFSAHHCHCPRRWKCWAQGLGTALATPHHSHQILRAQRRPRLTSDSLRYCSLESSCRKQRVRKIYCD